MTFFLRTVHYVGFWRLFRYRYEVSHFHFARYTLSSLHITFYTSPLLVGLLKSPPTTTNHDRPVRAGA